MHLIKAILAVRYFSTILGPVLADPLSLCKELPREDFCIESKKLSHNATPETKHSERLWDFVVDLFCCILSCLAVYFI